jgi:hypothetical protein
MVDGASDATTVVTGPDASDAGSDADATLATTSDAGDALADAAADSAVDGPERDAGPLLLDADADAPDTSDTSDGDATGENDANDAEADVIDDVPSEVADAPPDAPDGEGGEIVTTATLVQTYQGAACYSCAVTHNCLAPNADFLCEELDGAVADAGPEAGSTRESLCLAALQCILQSNCPSSGSLTACFCGTTASASCRAGTATPNGSCVSEEQNGLETLDASVIYTSLSFGQGVTSTLGAGVANRVAGCLFDNCLTCFTTP